MEQVQELSGTAAGVATSPSTNSSIDTTCYACPVCAEKSAQIRAIIGALGLWDCPPVEGVQKLAHYAVNLTHLYTHVKKRLFDEYAIELTDEWEKRVITGEHDIPFPQN